MSHSESREQIKSNLNMKVSVVFIFFVLFIKAQGEQAEETTTEYYKVEISTDGGNKSETLTTLTSTAPTTKISAVLKSTQNEALATEKSQQPIDPQEQLNSLNNQLSAILQEKLENYSSPVMRPNFYGPPIGVRVNVIIREVLDISEVDMHMRLNLILELTWNDPRLKFEHIKENVHYKYNDWVWLTDTSVKDKIWIPPVSILNEKESVDHSPRFVQESLAWTPSGLMIFRTNVVTTLSCSMALEDFPMDSQNCSILIGSPSYRSSDVQLQVHQYLHPSFSSSAKNVELLGVRVSPLVYIDGHASRIIYSYELLLKRFVGYYIIGTFFPSALVVLISWLTFWMSRESAGERMALGVTCVLTITTLLISVQASAPKVSYIKAIDTYMGVCFTLVFSTLLQSTAVAYLLRKVQNHGAVRRATQEQTSENNGACRPPRGFLSVVRRVVARDLEAQEKVTAKKFILRCDVWCRVIFPLVFSFFNVAYWAFYLTGSKFDSSKGWQVPNLSALVSDGRQ